MEREKIVMSIQAADGLIVKEIQHGVVKTQTFIDGKPGHIDRKDIKRLGYKNLNEYLTTLKTQGYTEQK